MDVRISDSPFCGAAWRGAEASLFVLPKPENCGTDRPMAPVLMGDFPLAGRCPRLWRAGSPRAFFVTWKGVSERMNRDSVRGA